MYTHQPLPAEFSARSSCAFIGCGVIERTSCRSKGHGDNFFTIASAGARRHLGAHASHAYPQATNPRRAHAAWQRSASSPLGRRSPAIIAQVPAQWSAPTGLPQLPAALSSRRQEDCLAFSAPSPLFNHHYQRPPLRNDRHVHAGLLGTVQLE